ncbi:MAG: hypothetical protein PHY93_21550, partial [Bacteriovorax sp.]|nr:hypothetical protein [Bacteriovorax sp.]
VRVIDNISGTVLFETSVEKMSEAYAFAAMLEDAGLDIKIDAPGLTETLIKSLGATESEIAEYKKGMDDELADHVFDFGCAICPPTKTTK